MSQSCIGSRWQLPVRAATLLATAQQGIARRLRATHPIPPPPPAPPQVRMAPYALNLPHPPLARRFVQRQLALMRTGLGRKAAYDAVAREMKPELDALK